MRSTKTKVALGAAMVLGTVAALVPGLKFLAPLSTYARRVDKSSRSKNEKFKLVLGIAMTVATILTYVPLPYPWLHWFFPLVAIVIDLEWLNEGDN